MAEKTAADRRHEIVLLVLGFALTTVLGGVLTLQARYAEYRDTLRDWVYRLNRRRALLCRFFGSEIGGEFEERIMPEFNRLHTRMIDLMRMPRPQRAAFSSNQLNSEADPLNNVIYLFNNRLAEAIRSGNVGSVDPGNACDFSAADPVDSATAPRSSP